MAELKLHQITKTFGKTPVLRGISMSVASGELLVLVGPSGCGKSSLMNTIAGLETPSSGTIHFGGEDITHLSPRDRDMSMVFQSYALYPNMNVRQNMEFGLKMRGVSKAKRITEVQRVAQMLQISHLLARRPGQLSGGQRQRVAMGRALVRRPKLFLFDEPLSNLDAKLRVDMRAEIKKLHANIGKTIIYVTHDQVEAMTLGDRIAVMKDGKIQQLASPKQVYSQPANLFVASFVGSPSINLFCGKVTGAKEKTTFEFDNSHTTLTLGKDLDYLPRNKSLTLGLRPEHIFPTPDGSINASIEFSEMTGPDHIISARNGSIHFRASGNPNIHYSKGEHLKFSPKLSYARFFDSKSGTQIQP